MGIYQFSWPYPAGNVIVTGTFDEWKGSVQLNKDNETGIFSAVVDLGETQKTYYKFIVDGNWTVNQAARRENDQSGNENNVLYKEDITELVEDLPELVEDEEETPEEIEPEVYDIPETTTVEVAESVDDNASVAEEEYEEKPDVPELVRESQLEADVLPEASAVPEAVQAKAEVEKELEEIVPTLPAASEETVEPETIVTKSTSPTMSPLTSPAPTTSTFTTAVSGTTFTITKEKAPSESSSSSDSTRTSHDEKKDIFIEKTAASTKKEKRRSALFHRIFSIFR